MGYVQLLFVKISKTVLKGWSTMMIAEKLVHGKKTSVGVYR